MFVFKDETNIEIDTSLRGRSWNENGYEEVNEIEQKTNK